MPLVKEKQPLPHFKHAFQACALASLNNRVATGNELDRQALGSYTKALAATFHATRDPTMVKHDATLASVLLLSLFETMTARPRSSMAWGLHVDGAVQLVKERGPEQLRSKSGLDLFIAARTQMIIHALSTGKAPDLSVDWWVDGSVRAEHALRCQELSIRIAKVKAAANRLIAMDRSTENTELTWELIKHCQILDQELVKWSKSVPETFTWKTAMWEHNIPPGGYMKAEVYPGRVDTYQDFWAASVWNLMRCSRITLTSVIVRCVARVSWPWDYRTTPEYATASKVWAEAISDINASVPYLLGWFCKRKDLLQGKHLPSFWCGEDNTEKALPGYFLIWPLSCIQAQNYLTDSQRAWVKGRLEHIATHLGVRSASIYQNIQPQRQPPPAEAA
ncbi:negative acting factor [Pochonia chlamydosporia 170]|uniref:Negative acting factor n=1 Tax=Pochonia chlamydosporia 170 TaxID=1380566 RepID=A0A179F1X6_METCM|nr:negative acting factor [Pochonia chlamydosporia 170]OAQ59455.1 negative acting factor [Pochonia chlamydosporia 170]